MAHELIPSKYLINTALPISFLITPRVDMLVAGPAIIKTNAVPGDKPANINPAAIGVEAVAQMYMGIEIAIITNMAIKPLPYEVKKLVGTNVLTKVANNKPTSNHLTKSSMSVEKAYLIPVIVFAHALGGAGLVAQQFDSVIFFWLVQQLLEATAFLLRVSSVVETINPVAIAENIAAKGL